MRIGMEQGFLHITLEWWERILSVHGSMKIPVSHISSVHTSLPQPTWKEIRCPGTFLPGVIKAGTYYTKRGKEFWCVVRGKDALRIEMSNEGFSRLVLGITDGASWKDRITRLLDT